MAKIKIPDFLKYDPNKEPCKLHTLIKGYEEKFGKTWATAGFNFSDKELENIFETCLSENRTFSDVIGVDIDDIDEDDDI